MKAKIDKQGMKAKIDKQGRIYIRKENEAEFPCKGDIIIDEREVSISTTRDGRSFISGLKGYIEIGQEFKIVKKKDYEYSIDIQKNIRETTSELETKPVEINILKSENTIEGKAVRLFEEYMHNHSDRFAAIMENGKVISDIRKCKVGYDSVFADYVVYDKIKKRKVFFEIKGTSKTEQYWGGVTFKELKSAIKKGDDYYFAIICIDKTRKDPFIHLKRGDIDDPYSVFLTLDEFLKFSTRASLGIQFVIKYPNGEEGDIEPTNNGDNAYSVKDVKNFLDNDFIKKTIG